MSIMLLYDNFKNRYYHIDKDRLDDLTSRLHQIMPTGVNTDENFGGSGMKKSYEELEKEYADCYAIPMTQDERDAYVDACNVLIDIANKYRRENMLSRSTYTKKDGTKGFVGIEFRFVYEEDE